MSHGHLGINLGTFLIKHRYQIVIRELFYMWIFLDKTLGVSFSRCTLGLQWAVYDILVSGLCNLTSVYENICYHTVKLEKLKQETILDLLLPTEKKRREWKWASRWPCSVCAGRIARTRHKWFKWWRSNFQLSAEVPANKPGTLQLQEICLPRSYYSSWYVVAFLYSFVLRVNPT